MALTSVISVLLGYLLGSVPSGYIAGRQLKGVDIRQWGDGNMGAANVFRQIGALPGILVGLADAAKGAAAILVAQALNSPPMVVLLSGGAAVMGHNWPLWLGFRGGRGAATTAGVMLTLLPHPTFLLLVVAGIVLLLSRNSTWSCAFLFAPLPLVSWWLGAPGVLIGYSIALPCLVGFTHYLTTRHAPVHGGQRLFPGS
jgi:glycerol-3-phosphate acyltransferase PlsY